MEVLAERVDNWRRQTIESYSSVDSRLNTIQNQLSKIDREIREGYVTRMEWREFKQEVRENYVRVDGQYWLVKNVVIYGASAVGATFLGLVLWAVGWKTGG
jgi:hypothetical protein